MTTATATEPDDASATPWRGIALAASTPSPLPALARRPRSTWLARSEPWCCGYSLALARWRSLCGVLAWLRYFVRCLLPG